MRILKIILWVLLIVLIGMQFFQPEKNLSETVAEGDFIRSLQPSSEIAGILENSCYDCHSNNTEYPWYGSVAPVSYWLDGHIKDGKKHLNFSEWEGYTDKRKAHKMEEFVDLVKKRHMPLDSYLWIHKDAVLSDAQVEELVKWGEGVRVAYDLKALPQ